ncbi:MAG: SPOR domain-containing protein [Ignavibacteriales bacterium]|nr:SPOR domain-containing protein [Ignavibacteriales bacterium]
MKQLLLFTFTIFYGIFAGCTTSDAVKETAPPVADTAKAIPSATTVEPAARPILPPVERKEQGFVTHSDTIDVQVVSQKPDSVRQQAPVPVSVESKNGVAEKKRYFALQIGAFQQETNAIRAAEIFKKRSEKVIDQFYDSSVKLYRVLVGNFNSKEEAAAFQLQLRKEYPKEYSESWVAEVKE